jgi:hypothetical protein
MDKTTYVPRDILAFASRQYVGRCIFYLDHCKNIIRKFKTYCEHGAQRLQERQYVGCCIFYLEHCKNIIEKFKTCSEHSAQQVVLSPSFIVPV